MAISAKQLAILEALRRRDEAVSLPTLMEDLPDAFAQRSVLRWLAELVEIHLVTRTGKKRGTDNRPWTFGSRVIETAKQ